MSHLRFRPALLACGLLALCFTSCDRGKRFYPVTGKVFVDGKPGEGVMVIFHPLQESDPPLLPQALVGADGSFTLQSWIVDERVLEQGAPPGEYHVTCVWYPPDLQKYLGNATLPDRLNGKYEDRNKSQLRAKVAETATELPPFELTSGKK